MLTIEQRKNIRGNFLKLIRNISDKEYQRRVWIEGKGPEWDDFDETCCRFFDNGEGFFKNYKDFWIAEEQIKILNKFRDEFELFADDNNWPHKFIDTPEWTRITEMAKGVLLAFNYPEGTLLPMLTKEIGTQMLRNSLEIILSISDKEYQKRIWIRGEGPEVDDFTEAVCKFFDNSDPVLNEYEKCGITKKQYQVLKKFRDEFSEFSKKNDWPADFIDTPEWARITEMAKEVLLAFNCQQ